MANEQNLKPSEYKFTQQDAKKGQEASAKRRKERASLRKCAQDVLNGTYKDKNGTDLTGAQVVVLNMFKIASNPKNRQCIQASKILMELMGEDKTPEEVKKLNAEIELLKAKTKTIQGVADSNFEDLAPLAELLK